MAKKYKLTNIMYYKNYKDFKKLEKKVIKSKIRPENDQSSQKLKMEPPPLPPL